MKPFDLQKALAGEPVVTRQGKNAIHLGELNNGGHKDLIWKIELSSSEIVILTDLGGNHTPWEDGQERNPICDLFMAPVRKQEWVNIHYVLDKNAPNGQYYDMPYVYPFESEQEAKSFAQEHGIPNYMTSVLIREWEE